MSSEERGRGRGKGRGRHGSGRGRGPGKGRGEGRGRGIGRPCVIPNIDTKWTEIDGESNLNLTQTEIEVIKLTDIDNLTQEEVARKLNVSRATIWRYLQSARHKIATSIVSGTKINVTIEK